MAPWFVLFQAIDETWPFLFDYVAPRPLWMREENARGLTAEENEGLLRLAAKHKKQYSGKEVVNWKEVHQRFSARDEFNKTQLRSRGEVLKQTSTSTARARRCVESLYGGRDVARLCQRQDLSSALSEYPEL